MHLFRPGLFPFYRFFKVSNTGFLKFNEKLKQSCQSCRASTFHQQQQQQQHQQQQQIRTKNKQQPPEVLLSTFHLNGHSFEFHPQTQKLRSTVYLVQTNKPHQREVL